MIPPSSGLPSLETTRLRLREWRNGDLPEFARMNADARVMQFMAARLSREESDALVTRMIDGAIAHGFGQWAVEVRDGAYFIGFVGLSVPRWSAHFTPCVEIGWRLAAELWGHGYATEAAQAALSFGFEKCHLPEIVSFTTTTNLRSRAVMERLGMQRNVADDFDHPALAADHPLRAHVLYRLTRDTWRKRRENL